MLTVLLSMACSTERQPTNNQTEQVSLTQSPVTIQQIAKATIATLFSQPTEIMSDYTEAGVIYITYVNPEDGLIYDYRVQVTRATKSIIWATKEGRWRTSNFDEKLSYTVSDENLIITATYHDGSEDNKSYNIADLWL